MIKATDGKTDRIRLARKLLLLLLFSFLFFFLSFFLSFFLYLSLSFSWQFLEAKLVKDATTCMISGTARDRNLYELGYGVYNDFTKSPARVKTPSLFLVNSNPRLVILSFFFVL